jgi:hypothetical protein
VQLPLAHSRQGAVSQSVVRLHVKPVALRGAHCTLRLQLMVPPQPSGWMPHTAFSCAHVLGVQLPLTHEPLMQLNPA